MLAARHEPDAAPSEAEVARKVAMVKKKLASFDPRSRAILDFRFGITGPGTHSVAETMTKFEVSRRNLATLEKQFLAAVGANGK